MTQQPLVDDEVAIQRAVGPLLRARGYDVEIAGTGAEALSMVARQTPDLIVLDLGLPDLEGTEVCPGVRAASNVPIVVLSARGAEADKVNALDLGADDYVTKPFGPEELLARLRVALRRVPPEAGGASGQFRAGDLTLDYDRYRVLRNETEIRLTPKEFELLSLLARNHDRVLTPRHPQGCLGPERRRAAGAPVDARRPASQEDRAGPGPSTVLAERAMGRLSLCER